MITTITLNPALDKTILVEGINKDCLNRVQKTIISAGGKGINVSKALFKLGSSTTVLGVIAGLSGKWIENYLSENNIPHDFVRGAGETRTNLKVFNQRTQSITEFNEQGSAVNKETMDKLFHKIKYYANKSGFIVLSGSAPPQCSDDIYLEIISSLKGTVKTVLDADGILLEKGLNASPSIIKPNIHELGKLFNKTLQTDHEIVECGKTLIGKGIEKVLVSMGAQGSILITRGVCYKALPVKVQVKSTVGAGDSMLAGFLHGLSSGMEDSEALRLAAACGAAAVSTEGTEMFTKEAVEKIIGEIQVQQKVNKQE